MGGSFTKPFNHPSVVHPKFEASMPRMDGKVVAITGCTTGTGFVAAQTMAKAGAHVLMLNRASERATAAEANIKAAVPGAKVTSVPCDLMSFASTMAACQQVMQLAGSTGLDVLCNNAGVMALEDKATGDGYDVQIQTNHLSHFIICRELMPLLEKAASLRGEARLVHHSSLARHGGPFDAKYFGKNGGNLGGNGNSMFFQGARWVRYHHSKMANSMMAVALHNRLQAKGSKIMSLCAAPGFASTNLQVTAHTDGGFNMGGSVLTNWAVDKFSQSAADGAVPLLTCCMSLEAKSGQMWEPKVATGPAVLKKHDKHSLNEEEQKGLWTASEEACGEFKL